MIEILDQYPTIKQTFNFVPSLLEQIIDYSSGTAMDRQLELSLISASSLNADDKSEMLNLFFQANYDHMISPLKRFDYLYKSRQNALSDWSVTEWRDLQALFNLAWIDPLYRTKGPLKALYVKGERFTEEDIRNILDEQRKIISRIIPSLKKHQDDNSIEISVTPYYHPILPLLCDTNVASIAMPNAKLPSNRFCAPEDAEKHVADAVALYERLFGCRPAGMWPAEGSVSDDIIPILEKFGIKWFATDEEILAESLGVPGRGSENSLVSQGTLYRPYAAGSSGINIFFRDHALSDNIGFVYSNWDPQEAADDFLNRLQGILKNAIAKKIENPIVSVILDGENAWEYYSNDGHDFFKALYSKIELTPWLQTITFKDYLMLGGQNPKMPKIFPGSWINHNFSIWIGHEEDNKAWDLLFAARKLLVEFEKQYHEFSAEKLALAWKEIMIAEGSDWCWWFGEDHIGAHNDDFDRLFRSHLANVYRFLDLEVPNILLNPIRTQFAMPFYTKATDYINPVIDGKLTHYYEWRQAGFFNCVKAASTMHKSEVLVSGIWFGFDSENLYLRMDKGSQIGISRFRLLEFEVEVITSETYRFKIAPEKAQTVENPGIRFDFRDLIEIAIPFSMLNIAENKQIALRITVFENGKAVENWPSSELLRMELPAAGSDDILWNA